MEILARSQVLRGRLISTNHGPSFDLEIFREKWILFDSSSICFASILSLVQRRTILSDNILIEVSSNYKDWNFPDDVDILKTEHINKINI